MNIVVDTNIIISAIIKDGVTREIIVNSGNNFLIPEFELYEIYKYKEEIMQKAGLSKKEFNILLLRLLRYIRIIPTDLILDKKNEAENIIGHIDKDDVQFIATALVFNAIVWSDDEHFQRQKKIKALKTSDIINLFSK